MFDSQLVLSDSNSLTVWWATMLTRDNVRQFWTMFFIGFFCSMREQHVLCPSYTSVDNNSGLMVLVRSSHSERYWRMSGDRVHEQTQDMRSKAEAQRSVTIFNKSSPSVLYFVVFVLHMMKKLIFLFSKLFITQKLPILHCCQTITGLWKTHSDSQAKQSCTPWTTTQVNNCHGHGDALLHSSYTSLHEASTLSDESFPGSDGKRAANEQRICLSAVMLVQLNLDCWFRSPLCYL